MNKTETLCALGEALGPNLDLTVTQILDRMRDGTIGNVSTVIDEFLCVEADERVLIAGWKTQLQYPFPDAGEWGELKDAFEVMSRRTDAYLEAHVASPALRLTYDLSCQLNRYNKVLSVLRNKAIQNPVNIHAHIDFVHRNIPSEPLCSIGVCQGLSNICTGHLESENIREYNVIVREIELWHTNCTRYKYAELLRTAKHRVATAENIAQRELALNLR